MAMKINTTQTTQPGHSVTVVPRTDKHTHAHTKTAIQIHLMAILWHKTITKACSTWTMNRKWKWKLAEIDRYIDT